MRGCIPMHPGCSRRTGTASSGLARVGERLQGEREGVFRDEVLCYLVTVDSCLPGVACRTVLVGGPRTTRARCSSARRSSHFARRCSLHLTPSVNETQPTNCCLNHKFVFRTFGVHRSLCLTRASSPISVHLCVPSLLATD